MFTFKKLSLAILLINLISLRADSGLAQEAPSPVQSPINIDYAVNKDLPDIIFNYPASVHFDIAFTGKTVQANVAATDQNGKPQNATISLNGKMYKLIQIHPHSPSEHTIGRQRFALEWHLVHQAADKSRLVIGVFMADEGRETSPGYRPLFETIKQNMSEAKQQTPGSYSLGSCSLSPRALIPQDQRCWRYEGSLTSQPYSPVFWCVVRARTTISEEDLETMFTALHINTRALQDLKGRTVVFDNTLDSSGKK